MGNLMTSMYVGVSGLRVNQHSLNVTAHNISNVDTKGFTRQQILTKDFTYNTVGQSYNSAMQIGLGTDMSIIRQVRDVFMDKAYRLEVGRQGFYESLSGTVDEIENLFGELDGVAFKNSLSDLWSSLSDLAQEPDSIVKRGILISTSQSFINRAAVISKQLKEYQENLNAQIIKKVDRINEIGEKIKQLNTDIRKYESSGQQANDMRDTRNMLLDELGGLVNCSYKEDMQGMVSINIEGVQFLSDDHITYMAVEKVNTTYEQEKADTINELTKRIQEAYQKEGGGEAALAKIKASDDWKRLREYGNIVGSIQDDGAGNKELTVLRNDIYLIKGDTLYEVLPKQSDLLNVVWKGNGLGDVFRLTGEYNSASDTNIGSLKGLLVARGAYNAKYTDLPKEADYKDEDGNWLPGGTDGNGDPLPDGKERYEAAVREYNKTVDPSVLMMTQAQFDQLVHDVVVKINDILCPNTEVSGDSLTNLIEKKGGTLIGDAGKITVTLADGTELMLDDELLMLDEIKSSTGMDDDKTIGEAIFNRKNTDRYTEATLKDENGNVIKDANGNEIKVYIYNKEYESNAYSLFSIDELEINEEILQDYSKIPLSYNIYSGQHNGYDMETANKLLHIWDDKELKLDPNSLTTYNFSDYYAAMTSGIAYRGELYNKIMGDQEEMVNTLENKRQEVAGVSSDDELTNLIKYQHAYNASSRYINVINEMLEHIIQRLG